MLAFRGCTLFPRQMGALGCSWARRGSGHNAGSSGSPAPQPPEPMEPPSLFRPFSDQIWTGFEFLCREPRSVCGLPQGRVLGALEKSWRHLGRNSRRRLVSEVTLRAIYSGVRGLKPGQEVCGHPRTPTHLGVLVTWQLCLNQPQHLAGQNGRPGFLFCFVIFFCFVFPT